MMLNKGRRGRERILSRPSVELMTTDQITPRAEGRLAFLPRHSGTTAAGASALAVTTRRDDLAATPGRYGWDGGYGTSWDVDPKEELIGILLDPAPVGFWRGARRRAGLLDLAYQAIDD